MAAPSPTLERLVTFLMLCVAVTTCLDNDQGTDLCKDTLSNCDDYSVSTCAVFPNWAKKNCAKTCGLKCKVTCPDGWALYASDNQTCLKGFGFDSKPGRGLYKPWHEARPLCQDLGADLVIVKDRKKHLYVSDHFAHNTKSYWIGLEKVGPKEFDFQYVDGTKLGSYLPWQPGNPRTTGPSTGNCVCSCVVRTAMGEWENYRCRIMLPFVCEKPATVTVID